MTQTLPKACGNGGAADLHAADQNQHDDHEEEIAPEGPLQPRALDQRADDECGNAPAHRSPEADFAVLGSPVAQHLQHAVVHQGDNGGEGKGVEDDEWQQPNQYTDPLQNEDHNQRRGHGQHQQTFVLLSRIGPRAPQRRGHQRHQGRDAGQQADGLARQAD